MKDILQGCSPNSPEAIELNLTRAIKTAGLKGSDIASALLAQKAVASLNLNPQVMAKIVNVEKVIAENGVPAVEIARVIADGGLPKELSDQLAAQVLLPLPLFSTRENKWYFIPPTSHPAFERNILFLLYSFLTRNLELYIVQYDEQLIHKEINKLS